MDLASAVRFGSASVREPLSTIVSLYSENYAIPYGPQSVSSKRSLLIFGMRRWGGFEACLVREASVRGA